MPEQNQNQTMYLIYVDESYDESHFVYSATFVPAFQWNRVFAEVLAWRKELFLTHKIPLDYELHATDFVGGRGEPNENRDKNYRAGIFNNAFLFIERTKGICIINGITTDKKKHLILFEYVLNRINRTLHAKNAFGVLVCDEGNENKLISIVRKMKKANSIPDTIALYGYNLQSRNLPLERIIEDPLFKTSKSSYFIQLADFIAFGLLRNEHPTDTTKNEVKSAFDILNSVLIKQAFRNDPKRKGIVRV